MPRAHFADQLHHMPRLLGVHAGERLVEQQHLGPRDQRDGEAQRALQAVRQVGCELVSTPGEAEELERFERRGVCRRLALAGAAQQGRAQTAARLQVTADQHVIEHRQLLEQGGLLEGAHQAERGDAAGAQARDVQPLEQHLARGRRIEAADDVEGGGLAGAVRADQAANFARLDREREIVHGRDTAEPPAEPLDLEDPWHVLPNRCCRGLFRMRVSMLAAAGATCITPEDRHPSRRCGPFRPRLVAP